MRLLSVILFSVLSIRCRSVGDGLCVSCLVVPVKMWATKWHRPTSLPLVSPREQVLCMLVKSVVMLAIISNSPMLMGLRRVLMVSSAVVYVRSRVRSVWFSRAAR